MSDPKAVEMIRQFLSNFKTIKKFNAHLLKKEWDLDGDLNHDEKVHFTYEFPQTIIMQYLDEGSSGIRNNGMTATYSGGTSARIVLGESKGFGFLKHGIASLILKNEIPIYDSRFLDGEVFTINRAGLSFFHKILSKFLPQIENAKTGGVSLVPGKSSTIHFEPFISEQASVTLSPTDSITDLEERFGTLAYFIYLNNLDKFDHFEDLFNRHKDMTLNIEQSFTECIVQVNPDDHLPYEIELLHHGRKVGEYHYKGFQVERFD